MMALDEWDLLPTLALVDEALAFLVTLTI